MSGFRGRLAARARGHETQTRRRASDSVRSLCVTLQRQRVAPTQYTDSTLLPRHYCSKPAAPATELSASMTCSAQQRVKRGQKTAASRREEGRAAGAQGATRQGWSLKLGEPQKRCRYHTSVVADVVVCGGGVIATVLALGCATEFGGFISRTTAAVTTRCSGRIQQRNATPPHHHLHPCMVRGSSGAWRTKYVADASKCGGDCVKAATKSNGTLPTPTPPARHPRGAAAE